jgi:Fic family protein
MTKKMPEKYKPPYSLTSIILRLSEEIGEWIGRHTALSAASQTPRLRRGNRIRTVQASLAIENNSLSLEKVTAILDGKRVLGLPREIQEVRNAFETFDHMEKWNPGCRNDLLEAHKILMAGLVDRPGSFRNAGVGVFQGERVVHLAPPASRVRFLIDNLQNWLKSTDEHPLIASCVFHYEFEFIHPFADGNGRLGRLWQTLILSQWKSLMAFLPVETVIRDRQSEYYRILAEADRLGDATPFIEFMLTSLRTALEEASSTDHASDHVTDQVKRLLECLGSKVLKASELIDALGLSHRPTFRKNYLEPAIAIGFVEMTHPESPKSPTQRYRLTEAGLTACKKSCEEAGKVAKNRKGKL